MVLDFQASSGRCRCRGDRSELSKIKALYALKGQLGSYLSIFSDHDVTCSLELIFSL